jgi:hypothetical protein
MRTLSAEQFAKARDFLLTRARPLERAMFRFEFEQGSAADVLKELETFQNEDGGFGNALEPDFRLPASSATATTVALQYISRLQLPETPVIAIRALQYLYRTFDHDHQLWMSVPESVTQFPRAVWWEYPGLEKAEQYWANPSAEIVGYLYEFPGIVPDGLREALTRKAFEKLDNRSEPLEMHDLLCYLRLAERLPAGLQSELYTRLDPHVRAVVTTTLEQWRAYSLQPIQVAPSPESRYYPVFQSAISENLDFLIANQGDDGAWHPTWEWGRYEEEWQRAQEEWKGWLTLDNLRILRAYKRIET